MVAWWSHSVGWLASQSVSKLGRWEILTLLSFGSLTPFCPRCFSHQVSLINSYLFLPTLSFTRFLHFHYLSASSNLANLTTISLGVKEAVCKVLVDTLRTAYGGDNPWIPDFHIAELWIIKPLLFLHSSSEKTAN